MKIFADFWRFLVLCFPKITADFWRFSQISEDFCRFLLIRVQDFNRFSKFFIFRCFDFRLKFCNLQPQFRLRVWIRKLSRMSVGFRFPFFIFRSFLPHYMFLASRKKSVDTGILKNWSSGHRNWIKSVLSKRKTIRILTIIYACSIRIFLKMSG